MPKEMKKELDEYVENTKYATSRSEVVRAAIKEHLEEHADI